MILLAYVLNPYTAKLGREPFYCYDRSLLKLGSISCAHFFSESFPHLRI